MVGIILVGRGHLVYIPYNEARVRKEHLMYCVQVRVEEGQRASPTAERPYLIYIRDPQCLVDL